jgi:hypothetical protein
LEQEFGKVEAELVDKIKITHEKSLKEFPAGVCVEVASDEEKDFRLYIGSDGKWSVRYQMSGFEVGETPCLSRILGNYVFVTEKSLSRV